MAKMVWVLCNGVSDCLSPLRALMRTQVLALQLKAKHDDRPNGRKLHYLFCSEVPNAVRDRGRKSVRRKKIIFD